MATMNAQLIFLIGFMGSGKSHTGKQMAEKMGLPFFDLDEFIAERAGQSIPELFEEKGEAHFRNLEQMCLRDFTAIGKGVVATGGGTPCHFDNMEIMNRHGVTIYLKASPDLLTERLRNEREGRPLIADLEGEALSDFVTKKLSERSDDYERASVVFEQTDTRDIVEELYWHFLNITGH